MFFVSEVIFYVIYFCFSKRSSYHMNYNLKELDKVLTRRVERKKVPGVTVCVRGPEGVIFEKGYGVRDDKGAIINENTVMGIASMSKSTATLALSILATEGKFDFSDPVSKYFPNFRIKGIPQQAVTCRHLATHTAGIPPMEPLEWSIALNTPDRGDSKWIREMRRTACNQMNTIDQIIDYISEGRYPTLGGSGEYMSYSNEGYAILSYIVDQAAGEPLEEFLNKRVFGPIGMTRTVLDQDGSEARKIASDGNITMLWDFDDDGAARADNSWSTSPPFRSCDCVKSTAHDMARYYQCISNYGAIDNKQVIPAKAIEMLVGSQFPLTEKPYYCYGLNKRLWQGHTLCEHSGGLHGISAHGGLILGENYGFAALCNESDQYTDDLVHIMMNLVMGRPLEEEHVWLHPTGEQFAEPDMLLGEYICHEGIPTNFRVFVEDGILKAERPTGVYTLRHCGETWFQIINAEGARAGYCRFWLRNGKAWGVQVYTRIYQRIK